MSGWGANYQKGVLVARVDLGNTKQGSGTNKDLQRIREKEYMHSYCKNPINSMCLNLTLYALTVVLPIITSILAINGLVQGEMPIISMVMTVISAVLYVLWVVYGCYYSLKKDEDDFVLYIIALTVFTPLEELKFIIRALVEVWGSKGLRVPFKPKTNIEKVEWGIYELYNGYETNLGGGVKLEEILPTLNRVVELDNGYITRFYNVIVGTKEGLTLTTNIKVLGERSFDFKKKEGLNTTPALKDKRDYSKVCSMWVHHHKVERELHEARELKERVEKQEYERKQILEYARRNKESQESKKEDIKDELLENYAESRVNKILDDLNKELDDIKEGIKKMVKHV